MNRADKFRQNFFELRARERFGIRKIRKLALRVIRRTRRPESNFRLVIFFAIEKIFKQPRRRADAENEYSRRERIERAGVANFASF